MKKRSNCPISYLLDIVGDKWSLLIVRDLMFKGKCFYREFLESEEGMATNILADRLKRLEEEKIIVSKPYPENRTRKVYTLTKKGKDLLPILLEIIAWSGTYDRKSGATKEYVHRICNDREKLMAEVLDNLSE
ncbi:MAG: helix-turn-helix transcriptional regulator [Ignavibacteriae bacterium]|nr:helix-turn-helix transcriptional regulator [Ignavibacteriota bacterium]MCB9215009.1 helix-turn-helix transcriptional regulator [Ignavibacteria bacterium]